MRWTHLFHHTFPRDASTDPRQQGQSVTDQTLTTLSRNKPFSLYELIISGICHINRKLTNTLTLQDRALGHYSAMSLWVEWQVVSHLLSPRPWAMPSRGYHTVGHWWLTPANLATQEAEIRRITVRSQPGEIVGKTLPHTHTHTQNLHKKGLMEWLNM
jgi:hypothetical protein